MTVYKGKVTKEFIERRNELVANDKRGYQVAMRQWDFEFPEHHQCSIPGGHKIYEGFEYDTTHPFFGNCDFKHVNKENAFHISPYILKQIMEKKIDHIVTWKYKDKDWTRPLEEGDSVQYEVLEYIPASEILDSIQKETEVRGFTINL